MNDKTKTTGGGDGAGAGNDQGGGQQGGNPNPPPSTPPPAPWKKAKGARVKVLDWSKDPQDPVECDGTIAEVHDDGSIDVDVHPPHKGVEPYRQTGLTECTVGNQRPGQWKKPG